MKRFLLPRYRFYRQFIFISFVATFVVGLVLLFSIERLVTRHMIRISERANITLAHEMADVLFPPGTAIPPTLSAPNFQERFIATARSYVSATRFGSDVVLIRLYDNQGRIVLSIPHTASPPNPSVEPSIDQVLAGRTVSVFETAKELVAVRHVAPESLPPYVVETLVPLQPESASRPIGAFAIYRDITEEFAITQRTVSRLLLIVALGLIVLFFGQGVLVWRVNYVLSRRTEALESVLQMTGAVQEESSIERILQTILEGVLSALRLSQGAVCTTEYQFVRGFSRPGGQISVHDGGCCCEAFTESVVIGDVSKYRGPESVVAMVRTLARETGIRALVAIPIFATSGTQFGALWVGCRSRRDWTREEVYFLQAVGYEIGLLLERLELIQNLQDANAQLADALDAKEAMIRNVSHELRTPLTMIRGYTELMLEGTLGPLADDQRDAVRVVLRNVERLHFMVDRLVQIRSLEAGKVVRFPLDLSTWLPEIVAEWQNRAHEQSIDLQIVAPSTPVVVKADSRLFYSVIQNLLDNAFKFTPQGGTIRVRLTAEGPEAHIIVSDSGMGIPPDKLGRVFERFYQVDPSPTRKIGGMGIGLALCREIVNLHDGRIWAESEGEGRGTTFHVVIPRSS